ncbi:MAG: tripartite tricarboxylate transporter substrate binding protein [Betaproteobacteria bacterium]|nr:tripartite tricarboxylate transporter substrate binding protein [Betaproteobacteria bacterium]
MIRLLYLLLYPIALLLPGMTAAQDWPVRPVRFVIPSGPGGVMEAVLAATNPLVEARLGQRVLLENRPGGGGNVGAQAVLASAPDGYTILAGPSNVIVTNPYFYEKMSFDPLKEFIPITMLVDVPLVVSVSAKLPIESLRELLEHIRANPGKINYPSPGIGTPPHFAGEMLTRAAGLNAVHVPYKGASAAGIALITNEVQFFIIGYASLRGQIQGNLVRPIAVAAAARLAALPNVPTIAESGYPKIAADIEGAWWGLFAPKGTPEAIVNRIAGEYRAALAAPEVQARLRDAGLVAVGNRPAEFAAMLPPQAAKWEALSKTLGIKFN